MKFVLEEYTEKKLDSLILTSSDLRMADYLASRGRLILRPIDSGVYVKTNSYVGVVKLNSADLLIRPKIENDHVLYKMLAYSFGLDNLDIFDDYTDLSTETGWIIDLVVMCLVKEVDIILRKGLLRRYLEKEESLSFIRGKINFNRMASRDKNLLFCWEYTTTL